MDFLFFKDTRPMLGASPGRGAQLPMQHVLNGALHSALHRAFPKEGSLEGERFINLKKGLSDLETSQALAHSSAIQIPTNGTFPHLLTFAPNPDR